MTRVEAFKQTLSTLIEAPYALIFLVSYEEDRTLALIRDIAKDLKRPLTEWSPLVGFQGVLEGEQEGAPGDFQRALAAIGADMRPAIYALLDAHHFMSNPNVVRELREMEGALAAFGKTLLFISPVGEPPEELMRDVTILQVPLPDRSDLESVFHVVFPEEKWSQLDTTRLVTGALGLTTRQAMRAFHRARIELERVKGEPFDLEGAIVGEKRRMIQTSDVLEYHELEEGLDDVGGLDVAQ